MFGSKKNSENLFIERYYHLLRPGGRMGIVLPESVFDTSENKYIRLFLYKYFIIKAVVSLPQVTFAPYTPTKTSVLLAKKKLPSRLPNGITNGRCLLLSIQSLKQDAKISSRFIKGLKNVINYLPSRTLPNPKKSKLFLICLKI